MVKSVYYFTAKWCGPCQNIKPVWKDLEQQYEDAINFIMVDVDEMRQMAEDLQVESMPTFVMVKDKKEVGRFSGANETKLRTEMKKFASL